MIFNFLCLKALLQKGANINALSKEGHSPLVYALFGYNGLIKNNIDLMLKYGVKISATDQGKNTALHNTFHSDDNRIVSYLIENGVNVNAQTKHGKTALMRAISAAKQKPENIKLLLDLGADPNIKMSNGKRAINLLHERAKRLKKRKDFNSELYKELTILLESK